MQSTKTGIWLRRIRIVRVDWSRKTTVTFADRLRVVRAYPLCARLVEESTEKLDNALHDAAKRGNIEFLQQSLANKVCRWICDWLLYLGMFQASVLGLDKAGNTPFHWACYSGDMDCVKLLLPLSMTIINQKVCERSSASLRLSFSPSHLRTMWATRLCTWPAGRTTPILFSFSWLTVCVGESENVVWIVVRCRRCWQTLAQPG